jgi:hypothetical protein
MVTVLDSIPGSGKTTVVYERLYKEGPEYRALFVTPYLDEIERILLEIPWFRQPEEIDGRKLEGLKELLRKGECVATTHALFLRMDDECRDLIRAVGYSELIVDEVVTPLNDILLTRRDFEAITDGDHPLLTVTADSTRRIVWTGGSDYGDLSARLLGTDRDGGYFVNLKEACDSGTVLLSTDDEKLETSPIISLLWTIKVENFTAFATTTILTFMFEASYLCAFLRMQNVGPIVYDRQLDPRQEQIRTEISRLITIYRGRYNHLNEEFDRRTSLSVNWFYRELRKPKAGAVRDLASALRGFLEYHMKVRKGSYIWTTFLSVRDFLGSKRFGDGFLPCNMRATNDYRDRDVVAYLANRFLNPNTRKLLGNPSFSDDDYALAEMIQFIFRSAVRDGNQITVFIPNQRMRQLLVNWLK